LHGKTGKHESATAAKHGRHAGWTALFVGGGELWFSQIQRDVTCLQPEWTCLRADDCASALKIITTGPIETLVVDGQMPEANLLVESVKEDRPEIICLIRCEMSDRAEADAWKGFNIPLVPRHADAATLVSSLLRSIVLREWTSDPAIKALLPRIRKLPATPNLYMQVTDELRDPNGSLDVVAHLISHDPIMSAKLLQLVNSAFFGSSREITAMLDAVMILGTERIKSLVLLAGIFSQYAKESAFSQSVQRLLNHSVEVGEYARAITLRETKTALLAESAFTAGVLHDIGKLVLAGNLPEMFLQVEKLKAEGSSEAAAEMKVYGVSHATLGACLLAAWGLPLTILEAIAFHHEPEKASSKSFSLLTAVHAANVFAHENDPPTSHPGGGPPALSQQHLQQIGMADRRERWRDACGFEKQAS
jgi:putative nucleotidyltransferase with HDIG domain